MKNIIDKLFFLLTYLVIVVIPISFVLVLSKNQSEIFTTKIPVVDIVIWLSFFAWLARASITRNNDYAVKPPAPLIGFLIVSAMTLVFNAGTIDPFKEIIQVVDYFILAFMLFVNAFRTEKRLKLATNVMYCGTAAIVLYGFYQYAILKEKSYLISSVFDNRNAFGGFMSLTLPIIFGLSINASSALFMLASGLLIVLALLVTTSIPSLLSMFFVFFVMVFMLKKNTGLLTCIVFALAIVTWIQKGSIINDKLEREIHLYEPQYINEYHDKIRKSVEMTFFSSVTDVDVGPYTLSFSSSTVTPDVMPVRYVEKTMEPRKKDVMFGSGRHVDQRFLEWQAGLNAVADKPLFGVGIGNYQREIGSYYRSLPKLNTMEPDSNNGYIITASTTGVIGLSMFIWILMFFLKRIQQVLHLCSESFTRGLSLGLWGSLVAFSINNSFIPLIYQSTAVMFVFVLSMSYIVYLRSNM